MANQRNGNREVFWRGAVKRRLDSGMTVSDFCATEGLKKSAYYYWQRRLNRGDDEAEDAGRGKTPALVPVHLVDDRSSAASIEIVAENGFVIRVSEQASSEQLRRVLQALGELR